VHPFRITATNALREVVWLAAVELDDTDKMRVVNISEPEWGLMELPMVLELEDANGKKLVMNIGAPKREYLQ